MACFRNRLPRLLPELVAPRIDVPLTSRSAMDKSEPKDGPPDPTALPNNAPSNDLVATGDLLRRAKEGDQEALNRFMGRYRPRLIRWATGRLPGNARSLLDTGDLVQETLLRAIQMLDGIEIEEPGKFQAYVRTAVLNRIRDQVRWARKHPGTAGVLEDVVDPTPSPLDRAIEADVLGRYERAMEQLGDAQRLLVHLRLELRYSYEEIAAVVERDSPDAARMAVCRAVRKLAEMMGHDGADHTDDSGRS
jgi:RNA polymerase sigma factor (sigma-70 family)